MQEKIHVVHLINQLGRGGTERQLYLLLSHSAGPLEHRVVVFNPSPHETWEDELRRAGVPVLTVPSSCRGVARRVVWLWRTLKPLGVDVVHSWSVHDNPYAGVVGRLARIPVRWGSLRNTLDTEGARRLPSFVRPLLLRAVDRLLVNCRALADELEELGLPDERVAVLPNCVEIPPEAKPNVDLTSFGVMPGAPVVGVVANLRPRKNLLVFVRAMQEALAGRPRARALIVGQALAGEPGYEAEVRAEIERLGLAEQVFVTGFRADVQALLARLDVVCLSSDHEGMPNALLEAMAAGRPVVATAR